MSRKISVIANCQTGGLTAALSFMLPGDEVSGFHWGKDPQSIKKMADAAESSDILVTSAPSDIIELIKKDYEYNPKRVIFVPSILFHGFHPDMVLSYVDGLPVNVSGHSPYMSGIGVWSWRNGVSVTDAVKFFKEETYSLLHYHDIWARDVNRMRGEFQAFDLSFTDFFLPLQASASPFMYTVNHPNIAAIAQLARGVAKKIDGNPQIFNQPFERVLPDALRSSDIWPIYSGVSARLGLEPDFVWLTNGIYYDLQGFLRLQFDALDRQTEPIHCPQIDTPLFEQAMRSVFS